MSLSASGARIRGDDFQHLFAWCRTLRALHPDGKVSNIGIEDPDAGHADDFTEYSEKETRYCQIKCSVNASHLANIEWLTQLSKSKGPSILQKFYVVWKSSDRKKVHLELFTNRLIDSNDPVLALCDGQDRTVSSELKKATPSSQAGKSRKFLATHLGVNENEVVDFLNHISFIFGKSYVECLDTAASLMFSHGLRHDRAAIEVGINMVRTWVKNGKRKLKIEEVKDAVKKLNLAARKPAGVFLVQAIDKDLMPESATIALDWVALFKGDDPRSRRTLLNPHFWNKKLRPSLHAAALKFRKNGYRNILVKGYIRLPAWFTIGTEFGRTAGFEVTPAWNGQTWDSEGDTASCHLTIKNGKIGNKNDLAVIISISTNILPAVNDFLKKTKMPIGKYVSIVPKNGPSNSAIKTARNARGYALGLRDLIRSIAQKHKTRKIHLFLAMPCGLALLLGHRWDRMPDTQLYEDMGAAKGYSPSFFIPN